MEEKGRDIIWREGCEKEGDRPKAEGVGLTKAEKGSRVNGKGWLTPHSLIGG